LQKYRHTIIIQVASVNWAIWKTSRTVNAFIYLVLTKCVYKIIYFFFQFQFNQFNNLTNFCRNKKNSVTKSPDSLAHPVLNSYCFIVDSNCLTAWKKKLCGKTYKNWKNARRLVAITICFAKLYFYRRPWENEHSCVSVHYHILYMKTDVKFYCFQRHKFGLKALLWKALYFFTLDHAFSIYDTRKTTKYIFKVNNIFRILIFLLHVSALQERHLQGAQSILKKLCVCYVISAE
jgi:hypothetical protein